MEEYKEVIHDGRRNRNVTIREVKFYPLCTDLRDDGTEVATFKEARDVPMCHMVLKIERGHSSFDGVVIHLQAFTRFMIYDLDQKPVSSIAFENCELSFSMENNHQIVNVQYYINQNGVRVDWNSLPCTISAFLQAITKFQLVSGVSFARTIAVTDVKTHQSEIESLRNENARLKALIRQIAAISSSR